MIGGKLTPLLLLWYANLRLSRFLSESLLVTVIREFRRFESFREDEEGVDFGKIVMKKRDALDKLKTCLGAAPWIFTMPCVITEFFRSSSRDREYFFYLVSEAWIPQGCLMRESLCVDIPAAIPSTHEILYWLLSPLLFIPDTLTGHGLAASGLLAVVQIFSWKFLNLVIGWYTRRALATGRVTKAKFLLIIFDILNSPCWLYVLVFMYFMCFSTWRGYSNKYEPVLAVYLVRRYKIVLPLLLSLMIVSRSDRDSPELLSRVMRLEVLDRAVVGSYRKNPQLLNRLSDHALFEVGQRLLNEPIRKKDRSRIETLMSSRPLVRGMMNFMEIIGT